MIFEILGILSSQQKSRCPNLHLMHTISGYEFQTMESNDAGWRAETSRHSRSRSGRSLPRGRDRDSSRHSRSCCRRPQVHEEALRKGAGAGLPTGAPSSTERTPWVATKDDAGGSKSQPWPRTRTTPQQQPGARGGNYRGNSKSHVANPFLLRA